MRSRSAVRILSFKALTKMTFLEPVFLLHRLLPNPGLLIGRNCLIVLGLLLLSLTGCGVDDEQGPTICANSTPACATVRLIWNPVDDSSVSGYYIHYGKQSTNQPGSCEYAQELFVSSPKGTVTGLDLGSIYYFAVSAFNGVESTCSNEVFAHT